MGASIDIIVAGDIIIDCYYWQREAESISQSNNVSNYQLYKGLYIQHEPGGAIAVLKLIEANKTKCITEAINIEYSGFYDSEYFEGKKGEIQYDNFFRMYIVLDKFSTNEMEKCGKTYRVKKSFGTVVPNKDKEEDKENYISHIIEKQKNEKKIPKHRKKYGSIPVRPDAAKEKKVGENGPKKNIIVLHDVGNEFRSSSFEDVWSEKLQNGFNDNSFLSNTVIFHYMSPPLFEGKVWENLQKHYKKNVILIVNAEDLRDIPGVNISYSLSWEKTALDFLWEITKGSKLQKIKDLPDVIVCFGLGGAIYYHGDGRASELYFQPNAIEKRFWDENKRGSMKGFSSVFVSSLVHRLINNFYLVKDKDTITDKVLRDSIDEGIKYGLIKKQQFIKNGYGPADENNNSSNPEFIETIAEKLYFKGFDKDGKEIKESLDNQRKELIIGLKKELSVEKIKKLLADIFEKLLDDNIKKLLADLKKELSADPKKELSAEQIKKLLEDLSEKMLDNQSTKLLDDLEKELSDKQSKKLLAYLVEKLSADLKKELSSELKKDLSPELKKELSINLVEKLSDEQNEKLLADLIEKIPVEKIKELLADPKELLDEQSEKLSADRVEKLREKIIKILNKKIIEEIKPIQSVELPNVNPYPYNERDPYSWKIMEHKTAVAYLNTLDIAKQIVKRGSDAIKDYPIGSFGDLTTVDRAETEGFRSIMNIMTEYIDSKRNTMKEHINSKKMVRPLSIAVFGSPGSGKSFGIIQIANDIDKERVKQLDFNVSQFTSIRDLVSAFHVVRDCSLRGLIPIVFFDEFDCDYEDKPLGWLKYFLVPMQNGNFFDHGVMHPIGKSIFVFAGGVYENFSDFCISTGVDSNMNNCPPMYQHLVSDVLTPEKCPDFVSRLRGYVNILGLNPTRDKDKKDDAYIIRRAILLRSLIEKKAPCLITAPDGNIKTGWIDDKLDEKLLDFLLKDVKYKHESRSMEAILDMSFLERYQKWNLASLPSKEQLELHIEIESYPF